MSFVFKLEDFACVYKFSVISSYNALSLDNLIFILIDFQKVNLEELWILAAITGGQGEARSVTALASPFGIAQVSAVYQFQSGAASLYIDYPLKGNFISLEIVLLCEED